MDPVSEYRFLLGQYYRLRANGVTAEQKTKILERLEELWGGMTVAQRKKIWSGRR
jgi:hypothetical protein